MVRRKLNHIVVTYISVFLCRENEIQKQTAQLALDALKLNLMKEKQRPRATTARSISIVDCVPTTAVVAQRK